MINRRAFFASGIAALFAPELAPASEYVDLDIQINSLPRPEPVCTCESYVIQDEHVFLFDQNCPHHSEEAVSRYRAESFIAAGFLYQWKK